MKVSVRNYGVLSNGQVAKLFTIDNGKMSVCITDFGCTITGIFLPNKMGSKDDVLLGYSTFDGFAHCTGYSFGSIVGRFANRIGNAKFSIDGKEYNLDKNEKSIQTLHGGFTRYDHMIWDSKIISNKNGKGVKFTRISPDGEQGFPGNVKLTVIYTLNKKNELRLEYKATTDKKTPINLTNHAYFNLNGRGTIKNHLLEVKSDYILDVDNNLIPSGDFINVKDTPFDFNTSKAIGTSINEIYAGYKNGYSGNDEKIKPGYDHCYTTCWFSKDSQWVEPTESCFTCEGAECAILKSEETNRTMKVYTNQPGLQVYTANFIGDVVGKLGAEYEMHDAICLETQAFPDSPNKENFPNCILEPNEEYSAITVYSFDF